MSGDHHLSLERPYERGQDPLDMDDAREAARRVSRLRRDAEAEFIAATEAAASAESAYRQALAKRIVELRAESVGTTEAQERARGDCAKEMTAFRVAEGMLKAWDQRLRGIEGERSMLKSLIDYSAKVAFLLQEGREHTQAGAGR